MLIVRTPGAPSVTTTTNNSVALHLSAIFVALLLVLAAVYLWIERLFHVGQFHDSSWSARWTRPWSGDAGSGTASGLREPLYSPPVSQSL